MSNIDSPTSRLSVVDLFKPLVLFLISPLTQVLMLLLLAILLHYANARRGARWSAAIAVLLLGIFSQPIVGNYLLYPLEFSKKLNKHKMTQNSKLDVIYVPACYYTTTGKLPDFSRFSSCSLARLAQAAAIATEHQVKIVVSGGNFLNDPNVNFADQATALLISFGIDPSRIVTVNEGTTTLEEANAVSSELRNKSVLVVSSATHGIRLKAIIQPLVYQFYFCPVDYHSNGQLTPFLSTPSVQALYAVERGLYEYIALLKHMLHE